jgi:hypothetical protein
MAAAKRPRSKAGPVVPVPVGAGGGWVDPGLLGVSAASEHPAAAASNTATASVRHRGAQQGGRGVAGPAMAHLPCQDSRPSIPCTAQLPGRFHSMRPEAGRAALGAAVKLFDPADVLLERRKPDSPTAGIHVIGILQQGRREPPIFRQIVVPYTWTFRSTSDTRSTRNPTCHGSTSPAAAASRMSVRPRRKMSGSGIVCRASVQAAAAPSSPTRLLPGHP